MTTATLFNQLKAGRITKEQFLYEVRKDVNLPFISALTTFKEAIRILGNKSIISEGMCPVCEDVPCKCQKEGHVYSSEDSTKELADKAVKSNMNENPDTCQCGGTYEKHEDAGEKICASCGDRQSLSEGVCPHCGDEPCSCSDDEFNDMEQRHNIEKSAEDAIMSQHDLEETPSLKEQVVEFVKKAMEGGSTLEEAKEQAKEYFSQKKENLNEAKMPLPSVDRVNPYEYKKGLDWELGLTFKAAPDWKDAFLAPSHEDMKKAEKKVLKNLQKDPAYYSHLMANYGKAPKKEKVVKTVWDGHTKGKLAPEDKANVKIKKEGPVKTKGVKVMSDKGVTGSEKIVKENSHVPSSTAVTSVQDMNMGPDGKPGIKGLREKKIAKIKEMVKAKLKKDLEEDLYKDKKTGQPVSVKATDPIAQEPAFKRNYTKQV